jgi:hypothetical protein
MGYAFGLPDGRTVTDERPFELDGIAFPGNWLKLASDDELSARSITKTPVVVQQPTLSEIQRDLKASVDSDAEMAHLRFITPGAGMAMTYQEKKDQAVAVLAMGEAAANALANNGAAEFPTLSASVPIEAQNLYAAAQLVISRYEAWAALSRVIELARMNGKKSISDASDAVSARAAYEAITWPTP